MEKILQRIDVLANTLYNVIQNTNTNTHKHTNTHGDKRMKKPSELDVLELRGLNRTAGFFSNGYIEHTSFNYIIDKHVTERWYDPTEQTFSHVLRLRIVGVGYVRFPGGPLLKVQQNTALIRSGWVPSAPLHLYPCVYPHLEKCLGKDTLHLTITPQVTIDDTNS